MPDCLKMKQAVASLLDYKVFKTTLLQKHLCGVKNVTAALWLAGVLACYV